MASVCPTETTGEPALQTSLVGGGKRADGGKGRGREGQEEGVGEIWKEHGVMITGGCDKTKNGEREYLEEGEGQSALTIVREG